jgi:hypothetical protein
MQSCDGAARGASAAASQPSARPRLNVALAPQLREDVLNDVFARLSGHVEALCACACVCTAWRDAAADARLWRKLHRLRAHAARRLTDARLAALVARARGELQRLDVSGCTRLSAPGLAAAVVPQNRLSWFAAVGCANLSSRGIARALAGKRLTKLLVRGVSGGVNAQDVAAGDDSDADEDEDEGETMARRQRDLALLRSLVATEDDLDACSFCTITQGDEDDEDEDVIVCGALCGGPADRLCDVCDRYSCAACINDVPPYWRCEACGRRMCAACMDEAVAPVPQMCCFCRTFRCHNCAEARQCAAFTACGLACGALACSRCVRRRRFNLCDGDAVTAGLLPCGSLNSIQCRKECAGHFCDDCDHERCRQCSRCGRRACQKCVRNYPGCIAPVAAGARLGKQLCHECRQKRAGAAAQRDDTVPPHHRLKD